MKGFAPRVLVCDHLELRAEVIAQLLRDMGADPCRVPTDSLSENPLPSTAALALLSAECCSDAALERLIQHRHAQGIPVVCYANDLAFWPIGKRCRLLLAGARMVLDSSAFNFCSDLRRALDRLLAAQAQRRQEAEALRRLLRQSGIVGQSDQILSVFRWAQRAALTSDLPVLITGETGTGKELLARAIHHLDPKRSSCPFVAVNCSTITATLAESELFGHQRGAYTGGDWQRAGFFRAADQGVIFLDEIGELELPLQAKLLRVLQENRVRILGDDVETAIDVRVVAATNRPLQEMIEDGSFRADLYHRLHVLSIHLPALRERREDIEPLVQHFLARHNQADATRQVAAAPEFIAALCQLELPGNIRQLENLVRGAIARKERDDDTPLGLSDLPPEIWEELSIRAATAAPAGTAGAVDLEGHLHALMSHHNWSLSESLAHCERLMLTAALKRFQGNQTRVAQLLGITPRTVHNKLRRFKIATKA